MQADCILLPLSAFSSMVSSRDCNPMRKLSTKINAIKKLKEIDMPKDMQITM
jgi:hypothetical protein